MYSSSDRLVGLPLGKAISSIKGSPEGHLGIYGGIPSEGGNSISRLAQGSKVYFPKCIFPKCIFSTCIFPKSIFPKCFFQRGDSEGDNILIAHLKIGRCE